MSKGIDHRVEERATQAHYLYCVAPCRQKSSLGEIGIDRNQVYTIPWHDLSAVAHVCAPRAYVSQDEAVVETWVLVHQKVVQTAWERYGAVIPFRFDVILKGSELQVLEWLQENYEELKEKLARLEGKAEYGVKIAWAPKLILETIAQTDEQIREMLGQMRSMSAGTAYLYQQKVEKLLKQKLEQEAERYFKDFYQRIRDCVQDVRVERGTQEKEKDTTLLANLSCLVDQAAPQRLGEELERIQGMKGFSVRFTGPWPPYSFVSL